MLGLTEVQRAAILERHIPALSYTEVVSCSFGPMRNEAKGACEIYPSGNARIEVRQDIVPTTEYFPTLYHEIAHLVRFRFARRLLSYAGEEVLAELWSSKIAPHQRNQRYILNWLCSYEQAGYDPKNLEPTLEGVKLFRLYCMVTNHIQEDFRRAGACIGAA